MMRSLLLSFGAALVAAQDCLEPPGESSDPKQELCQLVFKNSETYDIKISPKLHHNHLLYRLIVAYRMGETADGLNNEFVQGGKGLDPSIPSTHFITKDNWVNHIGDDIYNTSNHYSDYLEFFRASVEEQGTNETLRMAMPHLVAGLAGDLFHAMITLGYAWESPWHGEIVAEGLAWLSTGACEFPGSFRPSPDQASPSELLSKLSQESEVFPVFDDSVTLDDRILQLMDIAEQFSDYDVNSDLNLDELLELSHEMGLAVSQIFNSTGFSDFFVLHLQTSTRALDTLLINTRTVLPLAVLQEAVRRHWRAVLYFFAAYNRPAPPSTPHGDSFPTWKELEQRAIKVGDTHLMKVVFLARENDKKWGREGADAVWPVMATRCVEYYEEKKSWSHALTHSAADDLFASMPHRLKFCKNVAKAVSV